MTHCPGSSRPSPAALIWLPMVVVGSALNAGCLLDPEAVLDEAALRVEVVNVPLGASRVRVALVGSTSGDRSFEALPDGGRAEFYVVKLASGAYEVAASALDGEIAIRCGSTRHVHDGTAAIVHLDLARSDDACGRGDPDATVFGAMDAGTPPSPDAESESPDGATPDAEPVDAAVPDADADDEDDADSDDDDDDAEPDDDDDDDD